MSDYKAEDIFALIKKRYEGSDYAVLAQVPNGTGGFQRRWIDAAVFSLWPSKGLDRMAFEIKVSRSDFIHELSNPAKHQWVKESFHQFWFVAPKDIIQLDEIPNGAGWMYPRGDKLCIAKHCQRNDNPKLDDILLAAFMRAANQAMEANRKADKKTIIENDESYIRARIYEDAVVAFCQERGDRGFFHDTKEDVLNHLREATIDQQLKQDRDHLSAIADTFQRDIADLFGIFAIIANRSLLKRDELGKHLISAYGNRDMSTLEALKANKPSDYDKRAAELIDTILSWNKLTST